MDDVLGVTFETVGPLVDYPAWWGHSLIWSLGVSLLFVGERRDWGWCGKDGICWLRMMRAKRGRGVFYSICSFYFVSPFFLLDVLFLHVRPVLSVSHIILVLNRLDFQVQRQISYLVPDFTDKVSFDLLSRITFIGALNAFVSGVGTPFPVNTNEYLNGDGKKNSLRVFALEKKMIAITSNGWGSWCRTACVL